MNEAIKLTIPHARPYHGVVRLVVGGLAARLDVSYEDLEDLQLALETVLANDAYAGGEDVTVEVLVEREAVQVHVGPVNRRALEPALAQELEGRRDVGLRRLLSAVVEAVELERRGDVEWVRMRKEIRGQGLATSA